MNRENRFKAKNISEFRVVNMTYLYINENLTQRRKHLFWQTKLEEKNSITTSFGLTAAKFTYDTTKRAIGF